MEGLGRSFDLALSQIATAKRVSVGDAAAASLIVVDPAANLVTVSQATAFSGGTTAALNFTRRWTQTSGVWTLVTAASGNTFTPAGTEDLIVVEFDMRQLADGMKYVFATIATAGTLIWALHDLQVQRDPALLRRLDS